MKFLLLFTLIASFGFNAAASQSNACKRPTGNPYETVWRLRPDYKSEVWFGVNDPTDANYIRTTPLYLGVVYGGDVMPDRFSIYFYEHRKSLKSVRCGTGIYPDGEGRVSAFAYVTSSSAPFPVPPPSSNPNWLALGSGEESEMRDLVSREEEHCNEILAIVRAYEHRCPR